jgi:site-specific recombinase XerD
MGRWEGERGILLDSPKREEYTGSMPQDQLPIFKQKSFGKVALTQTIEPVAPTGESSVMKTLPSYMASLRSSGYSESTTEKYFADVKKFSVFIGEKKIGEITSHDVEQWISEMVSPKGEALDRKTVNRKVSAIINYFSWLVGLEVISENPTSEIQNKRIQSKLPDYLYENEIKVLYQEASRDPRTYLIVLLLLETGMKSSELFTIKTSDVDISDAYAPELWIKHTGREVKKDRKVALPPQFVQAYHNYLQQYGKEETVFPYTDRFVQLLFADLKKQTRIDKELTPKTLRHTHVVRAYKRGEDPDRIFERIGLAPDSRKEADEVYSKLSRRGI